MRTNYKAEKSDSLFALLSRLRELDEQDAEEALEEATGVITDIRKKVDTYKFILDQLEGQSMIIKLRMDAQAAMKARIKRNVARIEKRLMKILEENETSELEGFEYQLSIKTGRGSVHIFADEPTEEDVWRYPKFVRSSHEWDKDQIKAAIKIGDEQAMKIAEIQKSKSIQFKERLDDSGN